MAIDWEVVALTGKLSPFRPVVSIEPCPYRPWGTQRITTIAPNRSSSCHWKLSGRRRTCARSAQPYSP